MSSETVTQRAGLVLLGIALATGMVLSALVVSHALEHIKLAGDKIAVKGYAEERIVSDVGSWRAILTSRGTDLQSASRRLETDAARVREFLEKAAAGKAELRVGAVSMSTQYEYNAQGMMTGRVAGYQLDQSFEMTSSDVALIAGIAQQAGTLIRDGVELNAMQPQYFYSALNDVKVRLLGSATRDAKLRAEEFAGNSDVNVGPLKSATQGVFQITQVNSTETADYGSYDTSTVDKVVKAVVTVEYAVERE